MAMGRSLGRSKAAVERLHLREYMGRWRWQAEIRPVGFSSKCLQLTAEASTASAGGSGRCYDVSSGRRWGSSGAAGAWLRVYLPGLSSWSHWTLPSLVILQPWYLPQFQLVLLSQ